MYITDEDLDKFVGDGSSFERLIHDLIRAEAWVCNIPQHEIDWDYRVNVPDGGKDVLIRTGNTIMNRKFIPNVKTVWSIKSGKDGLKPNILEKEIVLHEKVLKHLEGGGAFIWCIVAPANNKIRDSLKEKAQELAHKYEFNSDQIIIFYRDTITSWLKCHIGLIPNHLNLTCKWKTLKEWRRIDKHFNVPWVDFGNRSDLIKNICEHFSSSNEPNVLYLAGSSGIGKTRTVLKACLDNPTLKNVIYYDSFEKFEEEIERFLIRKKGLSANIVIDDVDIDQWGRLSDRMLNYSERIRIITIGARPKGTFYPRKGILEVPSPKIKEGVSEVIKSYNQEMSNDEAHQLAEWCDNDLRLALILVDANKRDPGLRNEPIFSIDDVWNRVLNLYESEIGDKGKFIIFYSILSLCIDIGNKDDYRCELKYLANHFEKSITDFDIVISRAINCELGKQQGRFFEAAPLALARWIFEKRGWDQLKNSAVDFINNMPTERMKKRFIERGQECETKIREEINSALAEWFQRQFPTYDLELIKESQTSKTFMTYAEMDPKNGLSWLKTTIERATSQELMNFDGTSNALGSWGGRRQIVWLCQHLACFSELFWDCETILYRLALHENEEGIGNNSSAIWCGLFLPILSWTATPFKERLNLYLQRLNESKIDELELILEALVGIAQKRISRMAPPKVIGGRIVPKEWRPDNRKELNELKKYAVHKILNNVMKLPPDKKSIAQKKVIEEISLFLDLDCLDILKELLCSDELNEKLKRSLRLKLDEYIKRLNLIIKERKNDYTSAQLNNILKWKKSLNPKLLLNRIKDLTSRSYWEHYHSFEDERRVKEKYKSIAEKILLNLEVLNELWEWFDSDNVKSSKFLGSILGELDDSQIVLEQIIKKISVGRCKNFIAGYLSGLSNKKEGIPDKISEILDSLVESYPQYSLILTLNSDYSDKGFQRILKSMNAINNFNANYLLQLRSEPWTTILNFDNKISLLKNLYEISEFGNEKACNVAYELLIFWEDKNELKFNEKFINVINDLLKISLTKKCNCDTYIWSELVKLLPDDYIDIKIDIAIKALVEKEEVNIAIEEYAIKILKKIAKSHPKKVMQFLGEKIFNEKTRPYFFINTFNGLFDAISLDVIKNWIEKEGGVKGARAMARHISSPEPKVDNPVFVPPLTEWLLTEFSDDDRLFREFCAGRHAFETRGRGQVEKDYDELEEKLKPYLTHELYRVKEWADYEINQAKNWIERDKQIEDELGRI